MTDSIADIMQSQLDILDRIDTQKDILTAILEKLSGKPGPSPVAEALQEIVATLREQTDMLRALGERGGAEGLSEEKSQQ